MANRRMIDPAFWESTKVAKLSMFERCLFLGIISNADDQGRMKAAMIRARVFPQDDLTQAEIQDGLNAIEAQQGIIRYTVGDDEFVQVRKWWDYQRPSWAWPSKYPAPPDWEDREKYRRGNEVTTRNWDESEPTPAPPPPEPEPEPMPQSAHSDPIVTPQRARPEPIVTSAPRDSGSGCTSDSLSGKEGNDSAAKPRTKPKKPKTRTKSPPAVLTFKNAAHRYPPKSWYSKIADAVGEKEDDLNLWHDIVTAYIGRGWNPGNVSTMLEFYGRREIPGTARASPRGSPSALECSLAAIDEVLGDGDD